MGIYDRDYMRRSPDRRSDPDASAEQRLEDFFSRLLGKHRRWWLFIGLLIVGLVLAGLLLALSR